jgi:hypothetical protein
MAVPGPLPEPSKLSGEDDLRRDPREPQEQRMAPPTPVRCRGCKPASQRIRAKDRQLRLAGCGDHRALACCKI